MAAEPNGRVCAETRTPIGSLLRLRAYQEHCGGRWRQVVEVLHDGDAVPIMDAPAYKWDAVRAYNELVDVIGCESRYVLEPGDRVETVRTDGRASGTVGTVEHVGPTADAPQYAMVKLGGGSCKRIKLDWLIPADG